MNPDQQLIFTSSPAEAVNNLIARLQPASIVILADSNTAPLVASPLLDKLATPENVNSPLLIEIPAGDNNKSLDSLDRIWKTLSDSGATRRSLLINVGGGMVTDLGGFAAATFKRGIPFINIPTTLLAAVDASVGGKTGINFNGLKNEIGSFATAEAVVISAECFRTLPHIELLSGYGELLKHSLLDGEQSLAKALSFDLNHPDFTTLQTLLRESVMVKERIVKADPYEKGLRKALNLGHTVAHALEAIAMARGQQLPHGIAVAFGLVVDMVLSTMLRQFSSATLHSVATYIKDYFPSPEISCSDYDRLIDIMRHDKKNRSADRINFTLLNSPGHPAIDCEIDPDDIRNALDITRDLLAI